MIRAAVIDLETGVVENVIIVNESDLNDPRIKRVPTEIVRLNSAPPYEAVMPVEPHFTKWIDGVGFTNMYDVPLEIEKHRFLDPGHAEWYFSEDTKPYAD